MPPVAVLSDGHGAQQLGGVKQLLFDLTLLLKTQAERQTVESVAHTERTRLQLGIILTLCVFSISFSSSSSVADCALLSCRTRSGWSDEGGLTTSDDPG